MAASPDELTVLFSAMNDSLSKQILGTGKISPCSLSHSLLSRRCPYMCKCYLFLFCPIIFLEALRTVVLNPKQTECFK